MYSVLLSKIEFVFPLIKDRLKKIVNENMKVVVMPWAFPIELNYDRLINEYFKEGEKKYNKYINSLLELGIEKENITILNCYEKDTSNFKNIINNADVLLLPGGNPEMFFSKVVQETEILYEIKHFKGIIIGESAGACLQFKRYFITARNNYYKYFAWYDGIGLTNINVYPHFDMTNNDFVEEVKAVSRIKSLIALPNNSFIKIDDKQIEFVGEAFKVDNENIIKIN